MESTSNSMISNAYNNVVCSTDEESEESTNKDGRKVGAKLDHFARALFPDMKSIRLVEHFLSFLKTSKAFAQHMDVSYQI